MKKANTFLLVGGACDLLAIIVMGALISFSLVIQGAIFQLIVSIVSIVYAGLLMGHHAKNSPKE